MSFFRAARSAARTSLRPRALPYSTAHAPAPKASSDVVWIVTSLCVFTPIIFMLSKPSTSHAAPHASHPVQTEVEEEPVEEEPVEEEQSVEAAEPVEEETPSSIEDQVAAGEPASKPKDVNEVAKEDGDEGKGEPAEKEAEAEEEQKVSIVV
ncbi:hypothetical protein RQP46_011341 [Phenoliferia psychrophenolica]